MKTERGDTLAGSGVILLITMVRRIPATIPKLAPTSEIAVDFSEELAQARPGAGRPAICAARSPAFRSATAISMMFMITMPPMTSRHEDDSRDDGGENTADAGPKALHAFGRIEHENCCQPWAADDAGCA